MGRMYTAGGEFASFAAADNVFDVRAPSTGAVIIHSFGLKPQTTTDAAFGVKTTVWDTAGTVGTAETEEPVDAGLTQAAGAVVSESPTSGTTESILRQYAVSTLAGLDVIYTPEERPIISNSKQFAVATLDAIATADLNWYVCWEEIG